MKQLVLVDTLYKKGSTMEIKNKENQNDSVPVQTDTEVETDVKNSPAFQAYLVSKQKRREVYKRLASS